MLTETQKHDLVTARQALRDWVVTTIPGAGTADEIATAKTRISHTGTLAYLTDVRMPLDVMADSETARIAATGLDDWGRTWASELYRDEHVAAAKSRIEQSGGVTLYVESIIARIDAETVSA